MATELAIAMTKNSMAPSRKLLYESGIFLDVAAGSTHIPIIASARVIMATTVLTIPSQYAAVHSCFSMFILLLVDSRRRHRLPKTTHRHNDLHPYYGLHFSALSGCGKYTPKRAL